MNVRFFLQQANILVHEGEQAIGARQEGEKNNSQNKGNNTIRTITEKLFQLIET